MCANTRDHQKYDVGESNAQRDEQVPLGTAPAMSVSVHLLKCTSGGVRLQAAGAPGTYRLNKFCRYRSLGEVVEPCTKSRIRYIFSRESRLISLNCTATPDPGCILAILPSALKS